MNLRTWVEQEGKGALSRLQRATGLAYTTVLRVHEGRGGNSRTLLKIQEATGGKVTVAEMMPEAATGTEG